MSEADWQRQLDEAHASLERDKTTGKRYYTINVRLLGTADGGRHKPVFSGYRPQLSIGGHLESREEWVCAWLVHEQRLDPGQSGEVTLFISHRLSPQAISVGQHLEFYEGRRLVATAEVTARHLGT